MCRLAQCCCCIPLSVGVYILGGIGIVSIILPVDFLPDMFACVYFARRSIPQCRFYMIRQGRTLGGVDWVSRLDFWLEMSHAVEIGSSTSASLTPLNSATILSFQHIFPYNFGSSLQKQACYILLSKINIWMISSFSPHILHNEINNAEDCIFSCCLQSTQNKYL